MDQAIEYVVMVDDNYHYQDESKRYRLGAFPTCEAATAACQRIVDEFLRHALKPGMTAEELYKGYVGFGEDPYIIGDKNCRFSAWTYAKQRCQELCPAESSKGYS